MKITVKRLRKIIVEELSCLDEITYNAWRTKQGKKIGDPVRVDADNTNEAGILAANIFGKGIDPFTIDIEEDDYDDDDTWRSLLERAFSSLLYPFRPSVKPDTQGIVRSLDRARDTIKDARRLLVKVNAGIPRGDPSKKDIADALEAIDIDCIGELEGRIDYVLGRPTPYNKPLSGLFDINDINSTLAGVRAGVKYVLDIPGLKNL